MKQIILGILATFIAALAGINPHTSIIWNVLVISWPIVAITVFIRKWDRF